VQHPRSNPCKNKGNAKEVGTMNKLYESLKEANPENGG